MLRTPQGGARTEEHETNMRTLIKMLGVMSVAMLAGAGSLCSSLAGTAAAAPIGTAFTYQGSLNDNGTAPTGLYDFRFSLWDAMVGGNQAGATLVLDDRQVTSGVFNLDLDFGSALYAGDARWLQIEVRQGRSDRKSTRLNSSHLGISYAVFCLKKK